MKKRRKRKETEIKRVKELEGQLARALADYDNLRRRTENEIEDRVRIEKIRFFVKLLSIFDMLINAQEHLSDAGLAIAIKEFEDSLLEEGIEKIDPPAGGKKNMKFNEELHEAVEVISSPAGGKKKGIIAEVILNGWKFIEGPVIRPTKVKVFR
jgi:molecular chaperone GrpE